MLLVGCLSRVMRRIITRNIGKRCCHVVLCAVSSVSQKTWPVAAAERAAAAKRSAVWTRACYEACTTSHRLALGPQVPTADVHASALLSMLSNHLRRVSAFTERVHFEGKT